MTNAEPSSPERQFDSRLSIFDRTHQDRPQTEDKELTAFLEHAVAEVLSKSEAPPSCPRCHGAKTWLTQRPRHPKPALPVFYCADCAKHFRRTTNTPLTNLKLHRAVAFLPLLSRQQSYMVAAQVLGIKNVTAMRWAQRFRAWLLQLDPSGYWEAKARLGLVPMPDIACLYCGRQGTVHYRAFGRQSRARGIGLAAVPSAVATSMLVAPRRWIDRSSVIASRRLALAGPSSVAWRGAQGVQAAGKSLARDDVTLVHC